MATAAALCVALWPTDAWPAPPDTTPTDDASQESRAGADLGKPGDRQGCVDSFKRAQRLRRRGELLSSRAELVVCGQPSCPDAIESKCLTWFEEVRAEVPTVVVSVRDHLKRDVVDASILIDGEVLAASVDGLPLEVDPGPREVEVRSGKLRAKVRIVAVQGERNRAVLVELPAPVRPPPPRGFEMPALGWVGFGVGAAGLVAGSATGLAALLARGNLECPGDNCFLYEEQALTKGRALAHASTASFGLAAAGLLTGVLALTWRRPEPEGPRASVLLRPSGVAAEVTF